jgi:alpha-maltose-1-phosphate synthase
MRILTVSHFFEDHGGGIERVAGHLCRQFARLGAEAVWAASDCDNASVGEVEIVPLECINPTEKLTGLPMPVPGARAVRTLRREIRRCDVVIVHDALYVTSIAALLMAKIYSKRVVLIQHIAGIPFSSRILRVVMAFANAVVTRPMLWVADVRVFISDTVRHDLLGPAPRLPYELLFNGVDGAIFHPKESSSGSMPFSAVNDWARVRRILFVGRYVEKKGLTVLRALAKARPDLLFLLVGNGPIRPGDWQLENVQDLGIKSPGALADLYRSADLLLLPSVGEGYPLVIQEAMACGLPVVCGEPTNLADPGVAGLMRGVPIELADPEGSARRCSVTIDNFIPTSVERSTMARNVLRRYNWEAMGERLLILSLRGHTPAFV